MPKPDDNEILFDFESNWNGRVDFLNEFIRNCDPVASNSLQIKLLRRDLRLRLLTGEVPSATDYEKCFPHFADNIHKILSSVVISIANVECPIEEQFGDLPTQTNGYEILGRIGRDEVSVHYHAIQTSLARKVQLRALLFPTPEMISRECTLAKLEHPSFENTIDVFQHNVTWMVASQLERGDTIADILRDRPESISDLQTVKWMRSVADALSAIHRCDVAHLSVSPYKIVARTSGSAILVSPCLEYPLEKILDETHSDFSQMLPFPYRSIDRLGSAPPDHSLDDTVALGLVLFQLLTKLPLEDFYLQPPLPEESARLKKLIVDQLNYAEVDPTLKSLCIRSTIGIMDDEDPCYLTELGHELLEWEKQNDFRAASEPNIPPGRGPHGLKRWSAVRGFTWFNGR